MKTDRRKFISSSIVGGLGAAASPLSFASARKPLTHLPDDVKSKYAKLDEVLKLPVLKKELFPSPVIIESVEYLRDRNNFLCRVRSKDGAEGMSAGHGTTSKTNWPIMQSLIKKHIRTIPSIKSLWKIVQCFGKNSWCTIQWMCNFISCYPKGVAYLRLSTIINEKGVLSLY